MINSADSGSINARPILSIGNLLQSCESLSAFISSSVLTADRDIKMFYSLKAKFRLAWWALVCTICTEAWLTEKIIMTVFNYDPQLLFRSAG